MDLQNRSHSRKNLLTGEWVLVSPHRTERPWQGLTENTGKGSAAAFDANCYLCPGNTRASGQRNPDYQGPFAFDNDYPALSGSGEPANRIHEFFEVRSETGCCKVICFSERHDLRLATMSVAEVSAALEALFDEFQQLDRQAHIAYVQIFENRGEMMGCSNSHPHAQIWATSNLPTEPAKELQAQHDHWDSQGTPLLADYLAAELQRKERVVCENKHFVAVVPFWAVWPFETLILPRRAFSAPDEIGAGERRALAGILRSITSANDRLFDVSAPYSMGFHPRPSDGVAHPEWIFHVHMYPPLLRSSTIRKHLVGFEMLGMPQRDLTPEVAAEKLRACIDR